MLLLSALKTIFQEGSPGVAADPGISPVKLAIAPLATPTIVPPAGVAAVLLMVMIGPTIPGMERAIAISLGVILMLDFLVMYFNQWILKVPGLLPALQLMGSVLIVVQVALGIDTILRGLQGLGVVTGG